jgi:hypothetical protein
MKPTNLAILGLVLLASSTRAAYFSKEPLDDKCCKYRYQFNQLENCCQGNFNSLCCKPLKALSSQAWKDCADDLIGNCEIITYRVNDKVIHQTVRKNLPTEKFKAQLEGEKDIHDWKNSRRNRMSTVTPEWYAQNKYVRKGINGKMAPPNYYMGRGGDGESGASTYNGFDAGDGGKGRDAYLDHKGNYLGKGGDGGHGGHAYGGGNAGHGAQGGKGLYGGDGGDGGDVFYEGRAGNGGPGGDGIIKGGMGGDGGNAYFGGDAGHGGLGGDGGDTYFGGKAGNGGEGGNGGNAWYGGVAGDGGYGGNGGNAYYGGVPGKGGDGGEGGKYFPNGPNSHSMSYNEWLNNNDKDDFGHHHLFFHKH